MNFKTSFVVYKEHNFNFDGGCIESVDYYLDHSPPHSDNSANPWEQDVSSVTPSSIAGVCTTFYWRGFPLRCLGLFVAFPSSLSLTSSNICEYFFLFLGRLCSLLIYRRAGEFCVLTLYITYENSFQFLKISSGSIKALRKIMCKLIQSLSSYVHIPLVIGK